MNLEGQRDRSRFLQMQTIVTTSVSHVSARTLRTSLRLYIILVSRLCRIIHCFRSRRLCSTVNIPSANSSFNEGFVNDILSFSCSRKLRFHHRVLLLPLFHSTLVDSFLI